MPSQEIKLRKIVVHVRPETYRALAHWGVDNNLDVGGAAAAAIEKMLVSIEADRLIERARRSDARESKRKRT